MSTTVTITERIPDLGEFLRFHPGESLHVYFDEGFEFDDAGEMERVVKELIENPKIERVSFSDMGILFPPYLLALIQAKKFPFSNLSKPDQQWWLEGYALDFSGLGVDNRFVEDILETMDTDMDRNPKNVLDLGFNPAIDDRIFEFPESFEPEFMRTDGLKNILDILSELRITGTGITSRKVAELKTMSPELQIVGASGDSLGEMCF